MSKREIIQTDDAPSAIGPYSQAVKVGNTVYISGQIPLDPVSMEVVDGGIDAEARRVFDNLVAISTAAGGSLRDAVKINISLVDLSHFAAVNAVMEEYLSAPFPARACVEVAALPRGVHVEIEAILELP